MSGKHDLCKFVLILIFTVPKKQSVHVRLVLLYACIYSNLKQNFFYNYWDVNTENIKCRDKSLNKLNHTFLL